LGDRKEPILSLPKRLMADVQATIAMQITHTMYVRRSILLTELLEIFFEICSLLPSIITKYKEARGQL